VRRDRRPPPRPGHGQQRRERLRVRTRRKAPRAGRFTRRRPLPPARRQQGGRRPHPARPGTTNPRRPRRQPDLGRADIERPPPGRGLCQGATHDHGWPPFILVCDVGHVIETYADFSGQGKNYAQFPDRQTFRIYLEDLRRPDIRDRLARIWTDPMHLDPARETARVTRAIAAAEGLPPAQKMRYFGRANALNRSADQSERMMLQRRRDQRLAPPAPAEISPGPNPANPPQHDAFDAAIDEAMAFYRATILPKATPKLEPRTAQPNPTHAEALLRATVSGQRPTTPYRQTLLNGSAMPRTDGTQPQSPPA
jgi:hypothetical protein